MATLFFAFFLRRAPAAGVRSGRCTWKLNTRVALTPVMRAVRAIPRFPFVSCGGKITTPERVRAISIARLWPSRTLHLRPIYVVVCDDPNVEILSWGGLRA